MKSLLVVLALSLSVVSFGQTLKIAPVVGVNATSVMNSDDIKDIYDELEDYDIKWKHRPALKGTFGAWVDYEANEKLGFRTGLLLDFKGEVMKIKYKEDDESIKAKLRMKYTYLELPLMVTYKIGDNGFKLLAGPSINFAISAKGTSSYRYEYDGDVDKGSETENYKIGSDPDKHDIKPIDLSFNLGLAKEIEVKDRPLEVSLMVSPSLTKYTTITKDEPDYFSRHFAIGFKVAYFFSIGD
ncbi:porin family protein [Emticicia fontis]